MRIYDENDFKDMLWKNGKGTTKELYRYPESGDFSLRISMAKITANGPFSPYPGIERHLIILSGQGCILRCNGTVTILTPDSPVFKFNGEDIIECKLISGEVVDFNVMVKPSFGVIEVSKIEPGKLVSQHESFVFDIEAMQLISLDSGEKIETGGGLLIELKRGP